MEQSIRIVVHGGVGLRRKSDEGRYNPLCEGAAKVGWEVLERGGTALEAVVASCVALEDHEHFNAGTGSRMRLNGWIEMDAALMDSEGNFGAVAAIQSVKNPILVARKVMETPHFIIAGMGAIEFARRCGFEPFNPCTKETQKIYEKLMKRMNSGKLRAYEEKWKEFRWHDTIGAVALDRHGNFAAGNSTGGIPLMLPGRVGDSPIPGAGLWAGGLGAIATTGVGEEILRQMTAKTVYDLLVQGWTVEKAVSHCIKNFPTKYSLGIIAVNKESYYIDKTHPMSHAVIDGS
jgi:isoaspartyl peptidase/L-asparaginase-like protein (Ntn-hydrolase superfamily)